jgi:ribosome-associated heat shock protein Hsp15
MTRNAPRESSDNTEIETPGKVRLDKWLWAARFFKTRALAVEAIDGGKITVNDDRPKRAKLVQAGDEVRVRLGPYQHIVTVRDVSARRGSAAVAQTLYAESDTSVRARALVAEQQKSAAMMFSFDEGKPSKKQRRAIDRVRDRR